jgi:hypothetical protein
MKTFILKTTHQETENTESEGALENHAAAKRLDIHNI